MGRYKFKLGPGPSPRQRRKSRGQLGVRHDPDRERRAPVGPAHPEPSVEVTWRLPSLSEILAVTIVLAIFAIVIITLVAPNRLGGGLSFRSSGEPAAESPDTVVPLRE